MIYNSVADVFADIDGTRESLYRSAEGLAEGAEHFRLESGRWSVAEVFEHLSVIERQMVQLCGMMLKKAESGGAVRTEGSAFQPFSLDDFVEQVRDKKLEAPDAARPTGNVSLSDSLASLRQTRAALHDLRPRLEAVDGTQITYPHPFFGPLNLYQWLAFIGAHEARHLRQIEALKQSRDAGQS